jgi:hypothetical protein
MKITTKHLVLFTLFYIYSIIILAQGTSVKEWTRKRHNIVGGHYGHPYAIFDRHENKDVGILIGNVRNRIKDEEQGKYGNKLVLATY